METNFEHNIKIDNHVITKLLEQNDKRALFIYSYSLRWNSERVCVPTSIAFILNLLNKKEVASNVNSVKSSLKSLLGMNLIKVYKEITLKNKADIDSLNKNSKIFICSEESLAENNYTLLKSEYVDMAMINESELEREDMVAIVLLLSRNIERRDGVLQVCWHSTDKLAKELKIRKARLFDLIEGLKELKVIYFEKLSFDLGNGKKKEHNIYSMFEDKEQVVIVMGTAVKLGVLDGRAKSTKPAGDDVVSDEAIISFVDEDEVAHYFTDDFIQKSLDLVGIELNTNSSKKINEVHSQYGLQALLFALYEFRYTVGGIDNPTGYMMKMLPIKAREFSKKVS